MPQNHQCCRVSDLTLAVSRANSRSEGRAEAVGVGSSAWFGWGWMPPDCTPYGTGHTSTRRPDARLADHLVRLEEDHGRQREAERLGRLEVDDEFK